MAATETAKPAVFLLDTMAFIFRAYHAMQRQRPMSTRTGVPTAAVYVFVNMLNRLRKDFSPEYLAAIFDVSAPLLRDTQAKAFTSIRKYNSKTQSFDVVEYAGYKANREAMPVDLAQQLPYIRRALEALRIPMLQHEGYEADDVIGTLAQQAAAAGHPVYIVSSDKDMMQLVNEQVRVLNPAKDNLVLDRAGVVSVLGVQPEQVIDVMALRGDAIDNIPGAPGIGDKGSVELIQQYGSVEAVLAHASEVKRKTYRESLEQNRETILLSKELVTIHTSVPMLLDLPQMQTQPPDALACRELFSELEFTSLLKELGAPQQRAAASEPQLRAQCILDPSEAEIDALLASARLHGLAIAYDAKGAEISSDGDSEESEDIPKTPSLLDMMEQEEKTTQATTAWIGLAADASTTTPVATALRMSMENKKIRAVLEDASLPKSAHDLKSLIRALEPQGIRLAGVRDDLMLYSYLVNPTHGSHRLEDVVARFGNQPLVCETEDRLPATAAAIAQLAPVLRRDLQAEKMLDLYETMDLPLAPVLLRMEQAGIRIDSAFLQTMSSRLNASMQELGETIFEQTGHRFNLNSPKQLGDVLFNKMNLPKPMRYGRGKVVSTAQDVLEELSEHHAAPRLVLEYRQLAKLKSNYADSLPLLADAQGRVHTTFQQTGTATGRLSSTNPNVQNIPIRTELGREIRAAFVPAPGNVLLSADYSQIELRLMAHFSEDPLLLKAYRENVDIHTLTASEVFGVPAEQMDKTTRNRAKAVNFGIVYGISAFGLSQQLGTEQGEAQRYIQRYFERYQGVRVFIDQTIEAVRRDQSVRTLFGRIRPIPDIASRNANQRGFAERTAINTPLQGTAADIIKLAMIRIDREMQQKKMRSRMVLQVHDELVFDVVPDELRALEPLVRAAMEQVVELKVPLVADIASGPNWRDLT